MWARAKCFLLLANAGLLLGPTLQECGGVLFYNTSRGTLRFFLPLSDSINGARYFWFLPDDVEPIQLEVLSQQTKSRADVRCNSAYLEIKLEATKHEREFCGLFWSIPKAGKKLVIRGQGPGVIILETSASGFKHGLTLRYLGNLSRGVNSNVSETLTAIPVLSPAPGKQDVSQHEGLTVSSASMGQVQRSPPGNSANEQMSRSPAWIHHHSQISKGPNLLLHPILGNQSHPDSGSSPAVRDAQTEPFPKSTELLNSSGESTASVNSTSTLNATFNSTPMHRSSAELYPTSSNQHNRAFISRSGSVSRHHLSPNSLPEPITSNIPATILSSEYDSTSGQRSTSTSRSRPVLRPSIRLFVFSRKVDARQSLAPSLAPSADPELENLDGVMIQSTDRVGRPPAPDSVSGKNPRLPDSWMVGRSRLTTAQDDADSRSDSKERLGRTWSDRPKPHPATSWLPMTSLPRETDQAPSSQSEGIISLAMSSDLRISQRGGGQQRSSQWTPPPLLEDRFSEGGKGRLLPGSRTPRLLVTSPTPIWDPSLHTRSLSSEGEAAVSLDFNYVNGIERNGDPKPIQRQEFPATSNQPITPSEQREGQSSSGKHTAFLFQTSRIPELSAQVSNAQYLSSYPLQTSAMVTHFEGMQRKYHDKDISSTAPHTVTKAGLRNVFDIRKLMTHSSKLHMQGVSNGNKTVAGLSCASCPSPNAQTAGILSAIPALGNWERTRTAPSHSAGMDGRASATPSTSSPSFELVKLTNAEGRVREIASGVRMRTGDGWLTDGDTHRPDQRLAITPSVKLNLGVLVTSTLSDMDKDKSRSESTGGSSTGSASRAELLGEALQLEGGSSSPSISNQEISAESPAMITVVPGARILTSFSAEPTLSQLAANANFQPTEVDLSEIPASQMDHHTEERLSTAPATTWFPWRPSVLSNSRPPAQITISRAWSSGGKATSPAESSMSANSREVTEVRRSEFAPKTQGFSERVQPGIKFQPTVTNLAQSQLGLQTTSQPPIERRGAMSWQTAGSSFPVWREPTPPTTISFKVNHLKPSSEQGPMTSDESVMSRTQQLRSVTKDLSSKPHVKSTEDPDVLPTQIAGPSLSEQWLRNILPNVTNPTKSVTEIDLMPATAHPGHASTSGPESVTSVSSALVMAEFVTTHHTPSISALSNNISRSWNTDVSQTQSINVSQRHSTDISQTHSTDISQTQNPDISQTQSIDVSQTQNPDISQSQNPDISQTQSTDISQTQITDDSQTHSTEHSQSQNPDISQTQITDVSQTHSTELSQSQNPDISQTQSTDIRQTQNPDDSQTQNPDVSQTQNPDVSQTQSTDVSQTQNPDISQTQSTDASQTQSTVISKSQNTEFSQTQSTELSWSQSTDIDQTWSTDTGWKLSTNVSQIKNTDNSHTQNLALSWTRSPNNSWTRSPDIIRTLGPVMSQTGGPVVSQTQDPDIRQTWGQVVSQTLGPDIRQTRGPGISQTWGPVVIQSLNPDISQTQSTDVSQTQGIDVSQIQSTDVSQTQSTDVSQTQSTDVSQTQSTDISQTQSTNVSQTQSIDISQSQSTDVSQTQSTDISQSQSTNVSQTQSTDISQSQSTNVSQTQSTDISQSQSTNVSQSQSTDVSQTQSTNVSQIQSTDISQSQITDIDQTWSTDTGWKLSTNVSQIPNSDISHTQSLPLSRTRSPHNNWTRSPDISRTQVPVISQTQSTDVSQTQSTNVSQTQSTDVSQTQSTDVSQTQSTDMSQTKSTDVSQTQSTDVSQTQSTDVSQTQSTDISQTQSTDISQTQSTNVSQTQSTDISQSQSTNVSQTQSTDISQSQSTDVSQTQSTDISQSQSTDVSQTQSTDISQSQSTNVSQTQSTDISQSQSTDISQSQSTNVSQSQSTDISQSQSTDVSQTQSTDISQSQSTNVSQTQSTDISQSQSTDVSQTQSTDISQSQSTNVSQTQSTDISQSQSTNVSQTQSTNVSQSQITDIDQTWSTDTGWKLSTNVSQIPNSDISHTQSLPLSRTRSPHNNWTRSPDISRTQVPVISQTQSTDISQTQSTDVSQTQSTNVSQTQSTDVSQTQSTNVSQTQSTDVSQTQSTDVSQTQSTDVSQTQSTDISQTQRTDISQTQSTYISQTQSTNVNQTQSTDINQTWSADTGWKLSTNVSQILNTDNSHTQSLALSWTRSPNNSWTRSPDISQTQGPDNRQTRDPVVSQTLGPDIKQTLGPEVSQTQGEGINWTLGPEVSQTWGQDISQKQGSDISQTRSTGINWTLSPVVSQTETEGISRTVNSDISQMWDMNVSQKWETSINRTQGTDVSQTGTTVVIGSLDLVASSPGDQDVSRTRSAGTGPTLSWGHTRSAGISQSLGPDVSQIPGPEVSQTQGEGISWTLGPDVRWTQGKDVSWTPGSDISQTWNTDIGQLQNTDISHTLSPEISQTWGPDISQTQDQDVSQTQGEGISQTLGPDISQTLGPDVSQTQSLVVSQTWSTDISQLRNTDIMQTLGPDIRQTLGLEVSQTQGADVSRTGGLEVNHTWNRSGTSVSLLTPSTGSMAFLLPTSWPSTDSPVRLTSTAADRETGRTVQSTSQQLPPGTRRAAVNTISLSTPPVGRKQIFIVEDQLPLVREGVTVKIPTKLILDMSFNLHLKDSKSEEYQKLAKDFALKISPFYDKIPGFQQLQIKRFSAGSVKIEFDAIFRLTKLESFLLEPDLIFNVSGLWLVISGGFEIGGARVVTVYVTEKVIALCGEVLFCQNGFQCVHSKSGNASCTSLCHTAYCKNSGICTHNRGQAPICQCPVGSDYWFMGPRCDYRMTNQILIAITFGVVFALLVVLATVAFAVLRRFKVVLTEAKIDQTRSSYKRFSRFDDFSNQHQSQSWLSFSVNSLDNPGFSNSDELIHLQILDTSFYSCYEESVTGTYSSQRTGPHCQPAFRHSLQNLDASINSINEYMGDSGKASDMSVCSWPGEPLRWSPFPILYQLGRERPFKARRPHSYYEGMELVNMERNWTA